MSSAPMFELRGVGLDRDGGQVLHDVDAVLPEGASAVVGPSGSGKSTLLRLLNRLVDPDAGAVSLRGTDLRQLDVLELRRRFCLVPQLPALVEGTVADNLEFAARLAGTAPDRERILELAGLDGSFLPRDARRLSVGERQRVMLARALALEPQALLLDEPTSALDPDRTAAIEATLAGLRREPGLNLVLVTHDLDQAGRLADWIVRLDDGRVAGQGAVREPERA